MNEHKLLRNRAGRRKNKGAVRLGDVVERLVAEKISPQQDTFQSIDIVWNQMLPDEIRKHCRLTDTSAGQIRVLVDSPAHMHELRLCSPQLIQQFQRLCPAARIRKIKLDLSRAPFKG